VLTPAEITAATGTGIWTGRNKTGTKLGVVIYDATGPAPTIGEDEILYDPTRGVICSPNFSRVLWGYGASRTRTRTFSLQKGGKGLFLNATWVSRAFTQATTGKGGDASRRVRRLSTVAGFQRRVLRNHVRVQEAAVTVGLDVSVAFGSLASGDITVSDPTSAMLTVAEARREPLMQPARLVTATLPRGEMGYRIGAQLSENGVPTGCNIVEIKYDLQSMTTRIVASNK
jgi:hypothetical protein